MKGLSLPQKKLFIKQLLQIAILCVLCFTIFDILLQHRLLLVLRGLILAGFFVALKELERDVERARRIALVTYTAIQAAYTYLYANTPEIGVWMVIYGFVLAIMASIRTTILGTCTMFLIYLYAYTKQNLYLGITKVAYGVIQVGAATIIIVVIGLYYHRNVEGFVSKLKKIAERDHLTGLYSRRILKELFESQVREFNLRNIPFSAILLDLDDFKKVNDTLGHVEGDRVLKKVGQIIRENVRKEDFPIRYGGDEFIVFLPGTDLKGAKKVALKLSELIQLETQVSVSAGVKEYNRESSLEEFLAHLDRACYRAKSKKGEVVEA